MEGAAPLQIIYPYFQAVLSQLVRLIKVQAGNLTTWTSHHLCFRDSLNRAKRLFS